MTRIKDLPTLETLDSTNWIAVDSNADEEASGKASPATLSAFVNSDLSPVLALTEGVGISISGDPQNPTISSTGSGVGDMLSAIYDPQNISSDAFSRGNHTGEQPISATTGLQEALDSPVDEPKLTRRLSARVGALFDTVSDLQADTTLTYSTVSPGDIIEAQGFRYEVAASDAEPFDKDTAPDGYHVINAGEVKLFAVDEALHAKAFGLADVATEQTALVQRILDIAATLKKPLTFSPHVNDILVGQLFLRPLRMILESGTWFTSNASILTGSRKMFNFDGEGAWHITGYDAGVRMDKDSFSGQQNHAWSCEEAIANGWNAIGTVTLEGIEGRNSGGDGFYFKCPEVDVVVRDIVGTNNRRQGTSIVACKSLTGFGGSMADTIGTEPQAGVDIEPNGINRVLGPIRWYGLKTRNNQNAGVLIDLDLYKDDGVNPLPVLDIYFGGLRSEGDNGMESYASVRVRRSGSDGETPAGGKIVFDKPVIVDGQASGISVEDKSNAGPFVEIIEPQVVNSNLSGSTNRSLRAAVSLIATGSEGVVDPGGVRIVRPRVDQPVAGQIGYVAFVHNSGVGSVGWRNVSCEYDPADVVGTLTNTDENSPLIATSMSRSQIDFKYLKDTRVAIGPSTLTLTDGRFLGRILTNQGAGGTRTVNLPQATTDRIGWRFMFEVRTTALNLFVSPAAGDTIVPIGNTAGRAIVSNALGSFVSVEAISVGVWQIKEIVGTWASD